MEKNLVFYIMENVSISLQTTNVEAHISNKWKCNHQIKTKSIQIEYHSNTVEYGKR